ncbi:MAG TPA: Ig-like domain-containing protein, partial [Longimicrobium sp.]|nr:Ig-like domain-containing protein [Longimicrobium sp.]
LVVGGQGQYVQLTSSDIGVAADTFAFDITVQNLIPQPMGTTDGTTLDPAGVRVFFANGPVATVGAGDVTVANPDGEGTFTAAMQPYFQYDEVLAQNQTSGAKRWKLRFDPAVESFSFTLLISTAVQFPDGWVDVSPDSQFVVTGGTQALTAVVRTAVGNVDSTAAVTWTTSDGATGTVDGSGLVTAVAPGQVTITATSGTRTGTASLDVCPDLPVGGVYTASMPGASRLCFAGGAAGAAEYTYMPVNLSGSASLSLSILGTGIQAVTGPPSPNLVPNRDGVLLGAPRVSDADVAAHLAARARDVRETASLAASRASRISAPTGAARRNIVQGVPAVGDLWTLNVAQGCTGTRDDRVGRVRSVGQRVIIVADTTNPAGGFTTAQYDSIALEVDSLAYPVDTANFGAPTDLDDNQRVVLYFTRAVNELSPPASSLTNFGYFTNRDLFGSDPAQCERSNVGEILYMLVPDPTGAVNSNVRTVSLVRGSVIRTVTHELQHLINASRRAHVVQGPFEEPWLDEGLSRIAEELVFYRTSVGLAPRQNIVVTNLTTGPNASRRVAAFNTYANGNLGNLRAWLQRPDTSGALKTTSPNSLAFQGVGWAFLRYSADRLGGSEPAFWASLVNTTLTGKANLQNAMGSDPDLWYRDFVAAMYADDAVAGVAPIYTQPSWNFRSLYIALNGSYQLVPRLLTNNTPLTLSYSRGGGTAYARFGVPAAGFATLTALSGGVAPTSPYQLIVVRSK